VSHHTTTINLKEGYPPHFCVLVPVENGVSAFWTVVTESFPSNETAVEKCPLFCKTFNTKIIVSTALQR
jgi:hypothetical protein